MDNRTALLHCALELFTARGYDAVGVQEIVEIAGVTKPTLYHYFGSKQGLLQALLDAHFGALNRALAEAAAYQGDLTLTLTKMTHAFFDFARRHDRYYRLQLSLWFAPAQSIAHSMVAAHYAQQYQIVEELFVQAAKQHGNMQGRQRSLAASYIGVVNTYIGMWLNGYAGLDNELVYRVVHQFEHGIYS
jgi:AcrR family transcriptional regulator